MRPRLAHTMLLLVALPLGACAPDERPKEHAQHRPNLALEIAALQQRSMARIQGLMLDDPADLRPAARDTLLLLYLGGWTQVPQQNALTALPKTIKVWRRSLGGNDSCTGQVDVLPLEDYVKGVLPHEWIPSWKTESLRSGAVAIRTYAVAWIVKGGKYNCADLCDTTYSQVYKDSTLPQTNQAVDATKDQVLVTSSGGVVFAEYSAENGDPTKTGVSDPVCAGQTLYGHGRGMCQWGSQRWAQQAKGYEWIALHYYPGSSFWPTGTGSPPDAGPPAPDVQPPPVAQTDGLVPPADSGPASDSMMGNPDGGGPFLPPYLPGGAPTLTGGCGIVAGAPAACGAGIFLVLLLLGFVRPRRPR